MNLGIVGCRDFFDYETIESEAVKYLPYGINNIVTGDAKGVDALAIKFAEYFKIPFTSFKALWNIYGKSAGPIRNKRIVECSDFVLIFWDGESRGTRSTIKICDHFGTDYKIIKIGDWKE